MRTVVIVHGAGGSADEHAWFRWLEDELTSRGYKVSLKNYPFPNDPQMEEWREAILQEIEPGAILIGHSIGPLAILHALEIYMGAPVRALFSIAGMLRPLKNEYAEIIARFANHPFDFESLRRKCEQVFVYDSDDDPYIPLEEGAFATEMLRAEHKTFHARNHLGTWKGGAGTFPELLEDILRLED